MSPKDFVNYLNGAVDFGGLNSIDEKNYKKLTQKLATVTTDSTKEGMFCVWLQGVVDMLDEPKMSGVQFGKVVNKLQEAMNEKPVAPPIKHKPINSDDKMRC